MAEFTKFLEDFKAQQSASNQQLAKNIADALNDTLKKTERRARDRSRKQEENKDDSLEYTFTSMLDGLSSMNNNLIQISNTLQNTLDQNQVLNETLAELLNVDKEKFQYDQRQDVREQRAELSGAEQPGGNGDVTINGDVQVDDQKGGFLKNLLGGAGGGVGGFLAGAGIGGGALLGGAGILLGGGGYLLEQLNDLDGKAIRENVGEILAIKDDFGSTGEFFVEGGLFGATMAGIGAGLAVFGAGSTVAGMSDKLLGSEKFGNPDWATSIVDNVTTLLSINDLFQGFGDALKEGGTFFVAMTAIGAGLGVFGAGSAVATLVDTGGLFANPDWATSIVKNVTTLLGINDLFEGFGDALTEGGTFFVAMTAIAAGLAVFGVGSTVATLVDAGGHFVNPDWAQSIVDNVATLLTISDIEGVGVDTAKFVATMGGISAGLIAFAAADGLNTFVDLIGGEDTMDNIVNDVKSLLGILDDENITVDKATELTKVLGIIGGGLAAFGAGEFVSTLANAASAVLSFLTGQTGQKSPVEEMLELADNADELTTASEALDSLTDSLTKLGRLQFDGSEINMKAFAEDLAESVPIIEKAIMGGTIEKFGPFNDIDFAGLSSPEIDYESAIQRIKELQGALSGNIMPDDDTNINLMSKVQRGTIENDELTTQRAVVASQVNVAGGTSVASINNASISQSPSVRPQDLTQHHTSNTIY